MLIILFFLNLFATLQRLASRNNTKTKAVDNANNRQCTA